MIRRMLRWVLLLALLPVAALALFWATWGPPAPDDEVRIFVARKILTLEEPEEATAVAVASGRILAVGSRAEVEEALGERAYEVDERFREHVLVPGFIDPHLHPWLGATVLQTEIVSAMEWNTPKGRSRAVRGREAFLERVRELDRERSAQGDTSSMLKVWGYHEPYHGTLHRRDLDAISSTRPIFVWQRSVHEMFFNGAALEALGMSESEFDAHPQADWERGHLWENGMSVGRPLLAELFQPLAYRQGLASMSEVVHRGGLTTVGDQAFPGISAPFELAMLALEMHADDTPYRVALVPNAMHFFRRDGSAKAAERAAAELLGWSNDRIRVPRHAKLFADGAIFSQLMQMSEPFEDGHHGEWLMTPRSSRR